MLTASWRLAGSWLTDICDAGFDHDQVKGALHRDSIFRARYLVLYDLVSIIVSANQQKFAVLATSARMYPSAATSGQPITRSPQRTGLRTSSPTRTSDSATTSPSLYSIGAS